MSGSNPAAAAAPPCKSSAPTWGCRSMRRQHCAGPRQAPHMAGKQRACAELSAPAPGAASPSLIRCVAQRSCSLVWVVWARPHDHDKLRHGHVVWARIAVGARQDRRSVTIPSMFMSPPMQHQARAHTASGYSSPVLARTPRRRLPLRLRTRACPVTRA